MLAQTIKMSIMRIQAVDLYGSDEKLKQFIDQLEKSLGEDKNRPLDETRLIPNMASKETMKIVEEINSYTVGMYDECFFNPI